jgi:arginine decarboxylase
MALTDTIKSAAPGVKNPQEEAPVSEAIAEWHASGMLTFGIPAHKGGRSLPPALLDAVGERVFWNDVEMSNGLDTRDESYGVQDRAEELAAEAFGAEQSFFSVNGSSLSLQAAIMAVAGGGRKLIIARNSHKSVDAGLIAGGVDPVWVQPPLDEELQVAHVVTPEAIGEALESHPDAAGVLIVSPTYYGIAGDIAGIADVCHQHDVPLLSDDAWGLLFAFHPELPETALAQGADLAVGSFHKTLPALGQTSLLSIQGDRIDPDRLSLCLGNMETTSTTGLLISAADACRREMALHGEELLSETLRLARDARAELSAMDGLSVMGNEVLGRRGAKELDETRIVIDIEGLGINGFAAADWLRENHRLTVELMDHRRLMPLISVGDDEESVGRLMAAMRDLVERADEVEGDTVEMPPSHSLITEQVISPSEAFYSKAKMVPLAEAAGEICAESIAPYPPGIPIAAPGERITQPIVDYLSAGVEAGMFVEGVIDTSLEQVRVVEESASG